MTETHDEDFKRFEEMMLRSGIEIPVDFGINNSGTDTASNDWAADFPEPMTEFLHKLVGKSWVEVTVSGLLLDKYVSPNDALEALKAWREPKRAAASIFWALYLRARPFGKGLQQRIVEKEAELDSKARETPGAQGPSQDESCKYLKNEIRLYREAQLAGITISDPSFIRSLPTGDRATRSSVDGLLEAARVLYAVGNPGATDEPFSDLIEGAYSNSRHALATECESLAAGDIQRSDAAAGEAVRFVACLAVAVVCHSYAFLLDEKKRDHHRAFQAYSKAAHFLDKLGGLRDFSLPFSVGGLDHDIELAKAVHAWELTKAEPGRVESWYDTKLCLEQLYEAICNEEWDGDCIFGPDEAPGYVYFPAQIEYCKVRLSDQDLMREVKKDQLAKHKQRMRHDYFYGLWEYLEPATQERIISAESEWIDGKDRGSCVLTAIEDYSYTYESELHSILFSVPEVMGCVTDLLVRCRDKTLPSASRNPFKLKSWKVQTLNLPDMAKVIRGANASTPDSLKLLRPVRLAVAALNQKCPATRLLIDSAFLKFIENVYQLRSSETHRDRLPEMEAAVRESRRKSLGIGCSGYLVELAKIKKGLTPAP